MHSIKRALGEHQPTHALIAFDHGGGTWRHALLPTYKASRKPMFQGLRDAHPELFRLLSGLRFAHASLPGFEADDLIATVATRAAARGFEVTVAAGDIDMCQLIAPGVRVYGHFTKDWRDEAWLAEKMGVAPAVLADFLALIGDDKKDIPGIHRLGPKGAAKLLTEHHSLDGVLEACISGHVGAQLRERAEDLQLWRRLFRLRRDAPLSIRPLDLALPNRGVRTSPPRGAERITH